MVMIMNAVREQFRRNFELLPQYLYGRTNETY